MLHILSSNAAAPSKGLNELARKEGEDNIAWLARNLLEDDGTSIVMVGGRSPISFRLRVAQSHVRNDLLPSYWSHVMLLGKAAKNLTSTPISEISLEPPDVSVLCRQPTECEKESSASIATRANIRI
jgi:hypothetical protein